jgi:uncharacterized protein YbgA (DUF1722 family)
MMMYFEYPFEGETVENLCRMITEGNQYNLLENLIKRYSPELRTVLSSLLEDVWPFSFFLIR